MKRSVVSREWSVVGGQRPEVRRACRADATGSAGRRVGFTLIELLVVVGIIVLLIGILIPALGMTRQLARRSQTTSLMSSLAANIDAYYTRFHAYPGPLSAVQTTANSNRVSGTQNLMVGLSYGFVPTGGAPAFPGGGGGVKSLQAPGPVDYATMRPDGTNEQLGAFFEPSPKQVFDFTKNNTLNGNTFAVPVVVDAFMDGLPILYYRRTTGSENVAAGGQANITNNNPPGYYFDENKEYTNPSGSMLNATSGVGCAQNTTIGSTQYQFRAEELNAMVSVDGTTTGKVRGGFVLISAGVDRHYGNKIVSGKSSTDDIAVVGGD